MSWPLFVNWHTPEYAEEARKLGESLVAFNLPRTLTVHPSLGSWQRNCCHKPIHILDALRTHRVPVVWLDADAELFREPLHLLHCWADLAYVRRKGEVQASLLYCHYRPQVLEFLERWVARCRDVYMHTDQDHLAAELAATGESLARLELPAGYCCFPEDTFLCREVHILQHQASRRLARVTGSEPPPPPPKGGGA